ncbi:hypothetical protein BBO99_00002557 [Phytophthora kernoviae]|uniref:Uncharacterized protein n=1 Tax=Phytophthora kernoviae TaxID=325452 RepID=A0A3R7KWS7_9STRA|nr:hypothetical protein JM16_003498 [Phytophthora kernoviae]RLN20927.1 hypothetical protein BBI17_002456 [Phytophthora kernoviae]RLN82861.1 hypothetical protein BBO99_00002557 [Phytophthora kernoviae]
MTQRELIHELVDRSRERVAQVRAGNSLHRVLQHDALTHSHSSPSTLPFLPPAPPLAIMPKHSIRKATHAEKGDGKKDRRRHGVLPLLAASTLHLPVEASSFDQYQHFMDSKVYREETLNQRQRRVALAPRADLLKKLAVVCAAALAEVEKETNAPIVRESLREKLLRATALLRGGRAFENAKMLPPPPPPAYAEIKNAHLAFLEFKRDGVSPTKQKRIHPSAGLQDVNTSAKTPIHFGDQICLLSSMSDVPLAIGPDGRSRATLDSSVGPHMTFTIVDFRNPSRYDEVTATDDFWLRVDPTFLAPRKHLDPQRLYFHPTQTII